MKESYYTGTVKDEINNKIITIKEAVAVYNDDYTNRYTLTVNLENGGKDTLIAIMFNPSEKTIKKRISTKDTPVDLTENGKKKTFVDGTITNVIRIADKCKYSKIIILNLFSIITSDPKDILKNPQNYINDVNNEEISRNLKTNSDVLIAWGHDNQQIITETKKKWLSQAQGALKYFCWNETSNTPTHPSPFNYKKVADFLKNGTCLYLIKNINNQL